MEPVICPTHFKPNPYKILLKTGRIRELKMEAWPVEQPYSLLLVSSFWIQPLNFLHITTKWWDCHQRRHQPSNQIRKNISNTQRTIWIIICIFDGHIVDICQKLIWSTTKSNCEVLSFIFSTQCQPISEHIIVFPTTKFSIVEMSIPLIFWIHQHKNFHKNLLCSLKVFQYFSQH